jgi:hypothetical protein
MAEKLQERCTVVRVQPTNTNKQHNHDNRMKTSSNLHTVMRPSTATQYHATASKLTPQRPQNVVYGQLQPPVRFSAKTSRTDSPRLMVFALP